MRASANRPRENSLCAFSNAPSAADSSCVGRRGGGDGGIGEGLAARTAASFCVFLTLETATFLCCGGAGLCALDLAVAFLAFSAGFGVLATFFTVFTVRVFASFRVGAFATPARFALGLEGFAFIARFAVLAGARLTDGRVVDRRKAFVRLLLMVGNLKGYSTE